MSAVVLHQGNRLFAGLRPILALSLMILGSWSWAASHYVRAGAAGKQDGSDWTNAWARLPTTLHRGDIYYIANGSYPGHIFDDPESGQQPITIRKASRADHGAGAGWQAGYGDGTAQFGALQFARSYYVLDGRYRSANWQGGYGFKLVFTGRKGIEIKNQPALTAITIKYVEIKGQGVNRTIYDDGIYGLEDWTTGAGPTHLTISHCYIHDMGRIPIVLRYTSGILVEYNYVARNSSDTTFHSEGISDSGSSNLTVRYNIWQDIEGTAFIVSLGGGKNGYVDNWSIYGNILFYSPDNPTRRDGVGEGAIGAINTAIARNWRVYNNTFVNIPGYSARVNFYHDGGGNRIYNNLWYNCQYANQHGGNADSNYYINTPHNNEPHIQIGASDPFVNWKGGDFRLKGPTAAGYPLASPYNLDLQGRTRGQDGRWDRGALEYVKPPPKASQAASDGRPNP